MPHPATATAAAWMTVVMKLVVIMTMESRIEAVWLAAEAGG